jgi:FSR family fosmidomycin resistance protein-like MFS transporter
MLPAPMPSPKPLLPLTNVHTYIETPKTPWLFSRLGILLGLTCTAHFLHDASSTFLGVSLPALSHHWHFSKSMVGVVMAVFSVSASLLQPLWGLWADTLWQHHQGGTHPSQRRGVLAGTLVLVALVLTAGSMPWLGVISPRASEGLAWLLGCVALGALGVGIFHPIGTALMHTLSPAAYRHLLMNTFLCAGTLGSALGAWVYPHLGLAGLPQWAWLLVGVVPVYSWYAWNVLTYITPLSRLCVQEPVAVAGERVFQDVPGYTLKTVQGRWMLCALWSNNLCRTTIIMALVTFLPLVWREQYHLSDTTIAHYMMMNGLLGAGFGILLGHMLDRFPRYESHVLTGCFALCLLCTVPLMHTSGWVHVGLYWLLGAWLSASVGVNVVMGLRALKGHPNLVAGIIGGWAFGVSGVLMYPVGGLMEHCGTRPVLTGLLIVCSVCGLLSSGWFPHLLKHGTFKETSAV